VLADATAYGVPQTSYLLLNDGKGKFTVASENTIALQNIGILTTGVFADLNKDSWPDLVVAGEWMPITVFINNKGRFSKETIPNSTGLWQTLYVDDVNSDGHSDLLGGNWGWNNKFWSGKNGPLRLYVADFDNNGKTEQLVSYTANGVEYPFLGQDEVERPLPLLKKHYLHYADYAGVPMKDVFYGWIDNVSPFTAERLASAVCYGDGKGEFAMHDLHSGLQQAPIFAFQSLKQYNVTSASYLAGGNFFDVIPYEGRYDAQALSFFVVKKDGGFDAPRQTGLDSIKGQVRDMKWLKTLTDSVLIVARNNEKLLVLDLNRKVLDNFK
jgi:hypothetical protein